MAEGLKPRNLLLLSDDIAYPYSQMKSRSRIICYDTADPSEEEAEAEAEGGVVGGLGGAGASCR
jgi:hypothetical protein